jgi:hypothetical protein
MNNEELIKGLRGLRGWHMADMHTAADRIEQLVKSLAFSQMMDAKCVDDVFELEGKLETAEAKLAKAVAALHFYADFYEAANDGPWGVNSNDYGDKARAVLTELEKTS